MSLPAARVRGSLGAGFSEKYHVSFNTRTLWYQCCVLGQDTLPSSASLHSGVNEYRYRSACKRKGEIGTV